jgi:hypothetical protein
MKWYKCGISAAAVGTAAILAGGPASAGLLLEYNTGGPFTTICSAASGTSCSAASLTTTNGLVFTTVGATSNSPGLATGSDLLTATVQLTNPTGSTQSIEILSGDIGFTLPSAPPQVEFLNSISGTVITGGAANLFSSQACLSQANGQNVCPGDFTTPIINANIVNPGAGANSNFTLLSSLTVPYSMTEDLHITLNAGSIINFTASSNVTPTPAPEPSSLGVLGTSLIGLWGGIKLYRRRDKKRDTPNIVRCAIA